MALKCDECGVPLMQWDEATQTFWPPIYVFSRRKGRKRRQGMFCSETCCLC